jgi:hypothetical protein
MMPKRASTWRVLWLSPAGEMAHVLRFGHFFLPWPTYEDRSHIDCAYQPRDLDER